MEKAKPHDEGQGWTRTDEGLLKSVWSCGPILPTSLVDLLETVDHDQEEEEEEDFDSKDLENDE